MMQPWMKRPSRMVEKYQPSFSNIFPVSWTEQVIIINEYYRGHSCGNPASLTTKFEGRHGRFPSALRIILHYLDSYAGTFYQLSLSDKTVYTVQYGAQKKCKTFAIIRKYRWEKHRKCS